MSDLVVLCVNAGSSSLKLALFSVEPDPDPDQNPERERELWRWSSETATDGGVEAALIAGLDAMAAEGRPAPQAIGHRIVHGGADHVEPELIDASVLADLRDLIPLAPLHQPAGLAGIEAMAGAFGAVPQVACYDTAFHRTLSPAAREVALPAAARAEGVRRYGFHGLSYEYVVDQVGAERLGRAVIAHLGNGASLAAVVGGCSVDTTMGLTPTGGIVMGTRCGDLDPGVMIHLLRHGGEAGSALDVDGLEQLVNRQSGLLGLSGRSADLRALLEARAGGDEAAALTIEIFARTVRKQIGAMAAAMGGIDTVVFTGGIGEHASDVRAQSCAGLGFLGITIDDERNARRDVEPARSVTISTDSSSVTVLVVATDEDRMIARHAADLVGEGRPRGT